MNSSITNSDRAHILVQALPYIKKYTGETIVVKYGGNAMINEELKDAVIKDIILMQTVGINVIWFTAAAPRSTPCSKKSTRNPSSSTE